MKAEKVIKVLEQSGFQRIRQKGSHVILKHSDGRLTVVPMHKEEIGRGLLRRIIREAKLDRDEFLTVAERV